MGMSSTDSAFVQHLECPMLVMREPMKTSSILSPATSDSGFMSSGSFGQASKGSLID